MTQPALARATGRLLQLDGCSQFCLRDADSSQPVHRFGLMTDDYWPKPAFGTYHQLIADHAS